MDLVVSSFPYAVALSPLIAWGLLVLKSVWFIVSQHPVAEYLGNASMVVLETTAFVWFPILNALMGVAVPIALLLISLAETAVEALQMGLDTLWNTAHSLGLANLVPSGADFAKALYTVVRGFALSVYYSIKGLSLLFTTLETGIRGVKSLLLSPELVKPLLPFAAAVFFIAVLWWAVDAGELRQEAEKPKIPLRRSSRLQRKRAMLLSSSAS